MAINFFSLNSVTLCNHKHLFDASPHQATASQDLRRSQLWVLGYVPLLSTVSWRQWWLHAPVVLLLALCKHRDPSKRCALRGISLSRGRAAGSTRKVLLMEKPWKLISRKACPAYCRTPIRHWFGAPCMSLLSPTSICQLAAMNPPSELAKTGMCPVNSRTAACLWVAASFRSTRELNHWSPACKLSTN